MKKWLSLSCCLLLLSGCNTTTHKNNVIAAPPAQLIKFCETAPCRKNVSFKLKTKNGSYFNYSSLLSPPVIQPAFLSIYPNEVLYIEAENINGKLTNFKHVIKNNHPDKTIIFKFSQNDPQIGMTLSVKNPFKKVLRYHIGMMPLAKEVLLKTSSCPVFAGISSYEQWPFPIFQLVFTEIRLLSDQDSMACHE